MILSMDALFGLPRKHSAGYSCEALHGSLYFLDQSSVDEFVNHPGEDPTGWASAINVSLFTVVHKLVLA